MTISLTADGEPIDIATIRFSGGELHPRLLNPGKIRNALRARIVANVWSSDDVMQLLLVTSTVLHASAPNQIDLVLPYVPYARQDRVCYPGEAFGLQVFAELIGPAIYDSIEVWDPHSPETIALLGGHTTQIPAKSFVKNIPGLGNATIIAPDDGAANRARECAALLKLPLAQAHKHRNPETGELSDASIDIADFGDRDLLVVDDICDGGRTFVNLARLLRRRTTGLLLLYVTHGIFSAGFNELRAAYDHVYTANLHPCAGCPHDFVTLVSHQE